MLRSSLAVLFFLLFVVDCEAVQKTLAGLFNKSVDQCDDLYGHVCVGGSEMSKVIRGRDQDLLRKITTFTNVNGTRPYVFQRILDAVVDESKHLDILANEKQRKCRLYGMDIKHSGPAKDVDFENGKVVGRVIAYGRFVPGTVIGNRNVRVYRHKTGDSVKYYVTQQGGKVKNTAKSLKGIKNQFVRGIITGFYEELKIEVGEDQGNEFIYEDLKWDDFKKGVDSASENNAKIFKGIAKNIEKTGLDFEFERYNNLLTDPSFAGYGNVLFAHAMYSNPDNFNLGVLEDLEKMKQRILDEIGNHVTNASWLSTELRDMMLDYVKEKEIIIGIEEKYRNVTLLQEMLDVYNEEFAKVRRGEECEFEKLARAHGLARHKLLYSSKGSVMKSSYQYQYENTTVENRFYHLRNVIQVLPGYLHILSAYDLPTGFKHGYVGWAIGHEIIESLAFSRDDSTRWAKLQRVKHSPRFQNEFTCFGEFYDDRQFCMDDGECPFGGAKKTAGFADIESARVLFSILQKELKGDYGKSRRDVNDYEEVSDWLPQGDSEEEMLMSAAGYSEEQWFFIAQQFLLCRANMTRAMEAEWTTEGDHPRPQIAVNAVAQQMKQFTEAFGCKKGQKNYVTKKQCALYTQKDDVSDSDGVTPPADTIDVTSQMSSEAAASSLKLYFYMCAYLVLSRLL